MQDSTKDSPASISSEADGSTAVDGSLDRQTRVPASWNASGPLPPPHQPERTLRVHPLWLAACMAALFGLVFGMGAVMGSPSAVSAPSGTTIEQATINTIQTVDPSVVQIQWRNAVARSSQESVGFGEILTTRATS